MHLTSAETAARNSGIPVPGFRHVRNSLVYEDMRGIRDEAAEFLETAGAPDAHAGNLLLALTEILSNLVKHPRRKADYIEIRVALEVEGLMLEVLDNGTPFADFNAKCESALARLDGAVRGAEDGYGLGIILKTCGRPHYAPAGGADGLNRFSLSLGLKEAPPGPESKKKVFLVDDDPISLQIHRCMLERDYEVTAFENAEDALRAFPRLRPDLIVSDLTMPEMDGTALRRSLSALEGGDATPFIFLSGRKESETSPYISSLGVDDFLCKPVARERLHAVLSRLLRRSQQVRVSLEGRFHHDITELLKPSLPARHGPWTFVTRHRAAEAGGGDFILHHPAHNGLTGIIADVMGHGRQAKFFSCVYAGYLRSLFRMYAGTLDAAHFLRYLSQSIDGDPLLESMILTCQSFQLLPEGIAKIASAGHPHPLLLRGSAAELIRVAGPLPGLAGDSAYEMKSVRLSPGDRLLLMTDGFLEAFDRRGRAAETLLARIPSADASSAESLADALWEEFQERQRSIRAAPSDDATLIIIEYGGNP